MPEYTSIRILKSDAKRLKEISTENYDVTLNNLLNENYDSHVVAVKLDKVKTVLNDALGLL